MYHLQLRVEDNEVYDSPYFFSSCLAVRGWPQSKYSPAHADFTFAAHFPTFPVFRSGGVLPSKIWALELRLLARGWLQVREVASCREFVVSVQAGSVSHRPVLVPSMYLSIRAVADSTLKPSSCCGQWEFCHRLVTVWITALMLMERY